MKKLLSLLVTLNIVLLAGTALAGGQFYTERYFSTKAREINNEVCQGPHSDTKISEPACKSAVTSCSNMAQLCLYENCEVDNSSKTSTILVCTDTQLESCQRDALSETEQSRKSSCNTWAPEGSEPAKINAKSFLEPRKSWAGADPNDEEAQPQPETPENQDEVAVQDEPLGKEDSLDLPDDIDNEAPAQADQGIGVVGVAGSGKAGCSLQALGQTGNGAGLLQVFALFGLPLLIQKIRRKN